MHTLTIQELQSKIVRLSVLIVFLTGVAVAISVLFPLQKEMRAAANAHFSHTLDVKELAVDQYLARLVDIGRQIVSRTQIRKRLIQYNLGEVDYENVRAFSDPRLGDALKEAPGALGMVRLDPDLNAVSIVGTPPPEVIWEFGASHAETRSLFGPVETEGRLVVFAVTPIFDKKGERHGTDIVMFDLAELGALLNGDAPHPSNVSFMVMDIAGAPIAFGVFPGQTKMKMLSTPLPWVRVNDILSREKQVIVVPGNDGQERAVVSVTLNGSGWVLVQTETTDTLYADARQSLWLFAGVIVLMIAVGAFAMVKVLNALTGRVLLSTEELQQKFIERDRVQHQIIQAKNEAERANQAKSDFLASMSHELRTPLNAILGFGQLLQIETKESLSTQQREHVKSILEGGELLLGLVNQILDLAKIEANQSALKIEQVNVKDIIDDCIALSAPLGENRGVTVKSTFVDPAIALKTDRMRLKQVLLNLLSNAVAYNVDHGRVILNAYETTNGYLRVDVTDTGMGIAEDKMGAVFNKFHRFHDDPELATEGIGIGLAVTKQLIDSMSGYIDFESEEGKGSTFWFELPLATNNKVVIWDDTHRIGIEAIDHDHQHIVALINKLDHEHLNDDDLRRVVEQLISYTEYHYRREERVMEISGYPDIDRHCRLHDQVKTQVQKLDEDWRNERSIDKLKELQELLHSIWLDHVIAEDIELMTYARGRELEINQALLDINAYGPR